ncbi:MAG: hypothetical protein ACRC2U_15660, partial [Aeromonas sp.]
RNIPGTNPSSFEENLMVGIGPFWEVEYALSEHITLGTQAQMVLGTLVNDGILFTIVPPVGVFLNYYVK